METTKAMNLENAILNYAKSSQSKSKSVFLAGDIPAKVLDCHKKRHAAFEPSEKVLMAVNHKIIGSFGGYMWSGLLVTYSRLYFKCIKDSFLSGLVPLSTKDSLPLMEINSIEIGEHDGCFGTAYIGHQLIINNEVKGLLRMGGDMMYDEKMIDELNSLFQSISKPE